VRGGRGQQPPWLILAFAVALLLDSPLRWPEQIARSQGAAEGGRGVKPGQEVIPAGAGNRSTQDISEQLRERYPRGRGEQGHPLAKPERGGGSSSRARGTEMV